jgi:enoyl-CoA hydratase
MRQRDCRQAARRPLEHHKQAVHYARDHSVDDALKQMGWLQGAIWSHQQVHQAVTAVMAMKEKRAGKFPDLAAL